MLWFLALALSATQLEGLLPGGFNFFCTNNRAYLAPVKSPAAKDHIVCA